jgi:RNA polymerase sigma-70 factor (TIGR02957 family)
MMALDSDTFDSGTFEDDGLSDFFEARPRLFGIAYRMLGSAVEAEDLLQEVWLRWQMAERSAVESPCAFLVTMTTRLAINVARSARSRRETYVGPWLPEPLVTHSTDAPETVDAADGALRTESVSMALLVVLETLTPLERAVFVLHEVFGYAHPEIAEILDRSPSAVRQLAHRAREHVQARRPRYQADRRVQQQVTERFLAAALGGDIAALLEILAPDVTLWTDGGGKTRSAGLHPIQGREKVARLISHVTARRAKDLAVDYRYVNGDPSAVLFSENAPFAVMVLDVDPEDDRVRGIYGVTNPDKLTHLD